MSLQNVNELVQRGKAKLIADAVQETVNEGVAAEEILGTMIAAMDAVGEEFSKGELFVPEMLVSAKAMKKGVEVLKPYLASDATGALGKVVIGTVQGDLHDIGKNLVAMMMESTGFEVLDLGVDVSAERFVENYDESVRIVALSCLLTTAMGAMEQTVAALNAAPWRDKVRIMVGGAPITQDYADKIGADAYTPDAAAAAKRAKELVA